jgi:hypothetical protein
MNADETEVYDFLRQLPHLFVSSMEVSKRVGNRKRYLHDRNWARPILRRMELDGIVEANHCGEYRLKDWKAEEHTTFLNALGQPGIELGDTTIISIHSIETGLEATVKKRDAAAA